MTQEREPRVEELDPALIRAAAAGDLAAFERVVRAYQQHVWRFLRRLLGDPAAAEDVAQETFLRVYRGLPRFAHQAKFSTWVFQIARNAGIDELRKRQRQARLTDILGRRAPTLAPWRAQRTSRLVAPDRGGSRVRRRDRRPGRGSDWRSAQPLGGAR